MIRVCVTMRVTAAENYHEPRDSISHDWLARLSSWGMVPIPVPNLGTAAVGYVEALSPALVILSGGEDLGVSPVRDETETALLDFAMRARQPVLGVCRGLQLINSHLHGFLCRVEGHVAHPHDVKIDKHWDKHYGAATKVNSYHNICVPADGLAPSLHATATDSAGNIEALRHDELPVAAVMWHPERQGAPAGDRALVDALIGGES